MNESPGVSVVLMAYNEEALVAGAIRAVAEALDVIPGTHEIICVDDASTDLTRTRAEAAAVRAPIPVRVLHHEKNRGSGATKRTGFEAACGELVIGVPCDNPLTPDELIAFVGAARVADVVCGYRPIRPGYTWRMLWGSRLYRVLIRVLFGVRVRDAGWIKMFRRSMYPWLAVSSDGVFNHVEMLTKARYMGLSLAEVPCPMRRRTHGLPSIARPDVILGALAQTLAFWFRLKVLRRQPPMPPAELRAFPAEQVAEPTHV